MSISDDFIKRHIGKSPKSKKTNPSRQPGNTAPVRSVADDFIHKHNYVVDENFINTFLSDANRFMSSATDDFSKVGWGNASSSYENRRNAWTDLNYRKGIVQGWLESNRDRLDENYYKELSASLDSLGAGGSDIVEAFSSAKGHYSQWKTEDDYIKGATETSGDRQQRYEDNKRKIEELEAEKKKLSSAQSSNLTYSFGDTSMGFFIPTTDSSYSNRIKDINAEIETLQAENRMYERGEGGYISKKVDDYYKVTQNSDFGVGSANRDYTNATKEQLFDYDMSVSEGSVALESGGYFDDDGNIRDSKGNIVQYANAPAIEDKLGLFLSVGENEVTEAYNMLVASNGNSTNTWANLIREGDHGSWRYLDEKEIDIYYYLLNNSGQETAYKYLSDMKTELNRRNTLDNAGKWSAAYDEANILEQIAMNAATIPAKFVSNISGTIENAVNTMQGKDINPYSAAHSGMHFSQTVRGAAAEDLDETGFNIPLIDFTLGDIYQTGMSRLDSALATSVFGGGGTVFLGMGAAQEEAYKLYKQGASAEQVTLGSFAAGAAEAIWENLSYGKLKEIKNIGTPGAWVKSVLVQGFNEASEEALTEVSNIISNALIMGSKSDLAELYNKNEESAFRTFVDLVKQTTHAAFGGFIGGIGAGASQSTAVYADTRSQYKDTGRTIMRADGGVDALKNLANEVAGVSDSKMQNTLKRRASNVSSEVATGKNLVGKIIAGAKNTSNATKVGRLYNTVQTANNLANASANQADIAKSLQRKGFNVETANDIAEALVKSYNGQELTKAQEKLLESAKKSKVVQDAIANIMANEQSTMGQRNQNIRDFQSDVRAGAIARAYGVSVDTAKEILEGKHTTEDEGLPESQYEVSAEGKTIDSNGNIINIVGVESVKDGKMVLKTEDGTIDSSEVQYASEADALIYEAVAKMGASPSSAWAMIKAFNETDGVTAQAYATAAPLAYLYGKLGYEKGVFADGKPRLGLTATQSATVYQMGKSDAEASVKATTQESTESTTSEKNADKEIIFEGFTYSKRKANKVQKASMEAIEMINKMSNLEVHVYQSYKKDGKLYAVVNGKERVAPNGYFTDGNKVYIDINAGNMGGGLMLYTLSHEIGHYIAKWNAQDFKAISDFLFAHYGENVPVYDLLKAQKNKLKKSYKADGKPIPSETQLEKEAHEELVCDMLSRMLADKNAYDKLMELKQKDLKLHQKLGQAIKKALDKLAKLLGIYDTQSPDFMYAASVENFGEEAFRQLQDLYMRAFVQADANFQTAEKNTTEDGGGVKYMSRDIDSVTKETVRADLTDIFNGNNVTSASYVPLTKSTPFAVRHITGYTVDRPIIVEKKKAYFDMREDGIFKEDSSHHYHGMGIGGFLEAIDILNDPEYAVQELKPNGRVRYAFISTNEDGYEVCVVFEMDVFKPEYTMNGYPGGFYNLDITEFVATDEWMEAHGIEPGTAYVDYLLSLDGNSLAYDRRFHLKYMEEARVKELEEEQEKARNTDVGSAGVAASHINNRASGDRVTQPGTIVKSESVEALDVELDAKTESAVPAILKSERTWTESDYVQEREQAAKEIAKAIGVSVKKAKAYIDSVNSIAKMIAEDRVRLDYLSSPGRSSFVSNVEYGGSFDFSTLCKKRRLLTGTFTAIQKALPNTALTADEILKIRNRMKDAGLEVSCGLCYVEGSRANMGQFAKEFLRLYKQYYPDAWQPNMADVNTPDGIEWVRINHPECYEQYEYFWNHYGTLKPGDKNLFASQQKPKLYQLHTEYKGEILDKFNDDDNVEEKNLNGGIRLQSFSDFEIVHLIDTMQIIMDMSRVGLAGQAYTKVPDFAWALGDTGLKINLSLIAKGVDENGRLIFDDVEGMPIAEAMNLRDRYSKNVGTILVAFNDEQLLAAMADERVDFIIPFHRSQWKKSQYGAMGLPAKTKDYTFMQNEKYIKPQFHEYRGRMVKDKATNYMPNEYWDFSKSGKENAVAYLEMCARNNKRPKFYKLLQNNGDGSYSLKADGSTDGYWKLLIDFKMYDNEGNGSPQMPVKPEFNMEEANRMLNDYKGGHSNFPVAQGIVDEFVQEYKAGHEGAKFSVREQFYAEFDAWDKQDSNISFTTGTTSKALLSIGMKDQDIVLRSGTVLQKIKDHPEMTFDIFKDIPELLEHPIIVQFSDAIDPKTKRPKYNSSITVLGELYADVIEDGKKVKKPVLVSLELLPTNQKKTAVLDFAIIKSAYSKNALQQYINENSILYIDPDKKRTDSWLSLNRLQLPLGENRYGPIRKIAYVDGKVKVQNPKNMTEMQRKLFEAGKIDEFGNVIFSERGDGTSNRSLLANAFEGMAQNDIELNKIREYKEKIDLINAEESKLRTLNEQIKEMSFAKGPRDMKKIRGLQFEANQAANRISTYDKQLLRLEASKPLQDVLAREKKKAYKRAEQKGKEALAAYKEQAAEEQKAVVVKWRESRKAAVAKVRETSKKRDARAKLQKLVLDTVKWISYPAKTDVKCPDILKQPYADFLNSIDLSSKRLANDGDPTKNDLRLANAMGSLATALDRIMTAQDPTQDVDKVLDTGYLDLPANYVQQLRDVTEKVKSMMVEGEYVVNTMTADEVRQLSQMIRTLNHAIKTMSKLYANLRFANIEALGFDTMEFMDALGEIEKTGGMKDFVQWENALPYYAFKRFGNGGESVFEGLMDAQDKLAFLAQVIFNFQEKTWTGKEAKAWSEDTHTITLPNGNDLTLTTADAMSIYCLSRREQGLQHLLGGGTRVMGLQKGSRKAKDSRSTLTIKDIDAINSSLTDRQKQVADGIQEFMSTVCSEWGNEISMKRFLTKEFTEKFYFPIESNDENLPTKDPAAQQSDLFRLLNISATKPITPGANNEVIIRNIFDVFTGHASDMARLNAYGMALLDYMKWLNYREKTANEEGQIKVRGVRKSMEQAYGNAAKSYVLNLVKDVNGRASDGGDPNILMKWMRAGKTASVGNSIRVATLQITSYPRAALVLSPTSLSLGLTKVPNISRAKKYCGIALWKSFGFYDTNISRSIEDQMKGVTDIKQKLIELSLKGAEWGDAITWGALWNACEYEVAKTTKNKVGSEEFYQEVGKKLREVVYRTQVVDSTLTRSQIMRSKRGMAQEAAAFMSEPTLSANILMDAGFEFGLEKRRTGSAKIAWKKTGSYIGKAVAVYSIGQLTAALLEALWDAWRDDEDEKFGKKYLDAFVENLVLDLVPFNKIPIVSDVFEAVLAMFGVGFYSSDKMSTTWLTQAVSAVDAWKDALSGESSVTVYNALYKTTRAVSSFYGVSLSGVMREGVALWNNTAGAYDVTLKILTYDRSKGELGALLLDAYIEGDDRQAESLKAEFVDENESRSAIRTAVKNRYDSGDIDADTAERYLVEYGGLEADKAYWKVQEWSYEGEHDDEFQKYNDFYEAVQTGKNLKTVIKKYIDNGVESKTLASQITAYFKPLYKGMTNSERAAIKGYLLNAYELLGYDRAKKSKDIDKWGED